MNNTFPSDHSGNQRGVLLGDSNHFRPFVWTFFVGVCLYIYTYSRGQKKLHEAIAKQHHCEPVIPRVPYKWPLAIDLIVKQYQILFTNHFFELSTPYWNIAGTARIEFFGVTGFFTTDPENVEAVLSTHFEDYSLGSRRLATFPLLGEGIFGQDGPAWKRSRELIRRQFARLQKQNLQIFTPYVDELVSGLRKGADAGRTVDVKPLFFDYTLNTTTKLLFGEPHSSLPEEQRSAVRDNFDYAAGGIGVRVRLADLAWLYNPTKFKKACTSVREWATFFASKAMRYKDEVGEDKAAEKYSFIVDLWRELRDEALVRDQLLHILVAGRDSTASLLSWTLFHLLRNESALTRLQEEVRALPMDTPITREQIQHLSFLRCCLSETLRLYPTLPLNVRFANKTTVLPRGGGSDGRSPVLMLKGAGIAWSVYHLHRLDSLYGPDPRVYRPQRWENGELLRGVRPGAGYVDFNGGPRLCLGKDFALMEASYAIIRIMQNFPTIRLPTDEPNEAVGAERQTYTIGLAPTDGVKVLLA